MEFDAKKVTCEIVAWIQRWFAENGPDCNAIVGISGGKDSSVVAALCVKALGRERVLGVLMPNGTQADIDVARDLCRALEIGQVEINIDYILMLVMKYHESNCKDKSILGTIDRAIDSSIQLRSKKDLIHGFINTVNAADNVQ